MGYLPIPVAPLATLSHKKAPGRNLEQKMDAFGLFLCR